jgi:hypothetical protein
MEAAFASIVSVFICEEQSHIPENHKLTNRHCEKLKPFKITVLSVMKQISVDQHKPYVIIPLHQMQEIGKWEKP